MSRPPTKQSSAAEFATLLRVNAFFAGLDEAVIGHLASLCATRSLEAEDVLFRKGDPGEALYGIRRGQIRIESGTDKGQRVTLNALGAGDVFGEIALLDGQERTADAVAVEATEVFTLRRDQVLHYLGREPKVAIKFIELLCKRLRYVSAQMEESLTQPIGVRLARRLLSLSEDFGEEIEITQEQLATYLGVARESVNRQLRAWQREGLLDLRRGAVHLLKLKAITKLADIDA